MIIIGAGMAGLLAGGMIRDRKVRIFEAANDLPNNHSAVLRFRSSIVGDALDIQFKQVKMMKSVHEWRNPVADSLAYSLKCNGTATLRSIMSAGSEVHTRYIGPSDLIYQMSERINGEINYDCRIDLQRLKEFDEPIISTIPMPLLMRTLDYNFRPDFKFINGFNVNCEVDGVEAYVTVYIPDPHDIFNRVSLTGNRMTIEVSLPNQTMEDVERYMERLQNNASEHKAFIKDALFFLGIDGAKVLSEKWSVQRYSKILPIDEKERRNFIMWASANHNIYSLGRFATWRPGLLMDDVVNDVRVIRKIIQNGNYEHSKK